MDSVCLVALGGKLEPGLEQLWAGASPRAHRKLPPCQGWAGARWVRAGGGSSPGMSKATTLAGSGGRSRVRCRLGAMLDQPWQTPS